MKIRSGLGSWELRIKRKRKQNEKGEWVELIGLKMKIIILPLIII